MSLSTGMEEYYQKVIQLQERLRQSEEERLKLEMKFNEMLQMMKEEEEAHFKKLRSKYKQFLEEDRRRQQRNDKILEALDRIENRTVIWEAKTEKFKNFRRRYHDYVKCSGETRSRSPLDAGRTVDHKQNLYEPPSERRTLFSDDKDVKDDSTKSKSDIVEKYLQSLSSQKCKEDILQRKSIDKPSPESKYSNLGNINSYWKASNSTEKTDPEKVNGFKDEVDSIQLKTNKDLENSLKQNSKTSVPTVTKYDYSDIGKSKYLDSYDDSDSAFDKKSPTGFQGKTPDSSSPSYNQRQFGYDNNTEAIRSSSQQLTYNNGSQEQSLRRTSNQSPEQVHDELERLLKQHKDETNIVQNQPLQKPLNEQQVQKLPHSNVQPLEQQFQRVPKQQSQPVARQPPAPVNNNECYVTKPMQEYQSPNQVVEDKEDVQNGKMLNRTQEVTSPRSSPRPSDTNLSKLESNYPAPQQRLSNESEKPQSVNIQIKNQNELVTAQPNENFKSDEQRSEFEKDQAEDQQSSRKSDEPVQIRDELENNGTPPQPQYDTNEKSQEKPTDSNEQLDTNKDQPLEQQYDTNGQPTQQYDDNGQYGQQYYDENAQPLQQFDENGQPLQPYYDENGQPLQNYSGNEQSQSQYYDENGQPLQQYDENGQPLQSYDENGQSIQQYYDNAGQPLQQYDENGQPLPQYDQNGQPIAQYDENGQPLLQYDQNAQPQYDETGQPVTQYDENGQPIPQYDATGQPLHQYDENGQLIPQYDANGQVITQYDASGQPIQQYYDENGQPIQYYGEGESVPQYDENGQPIQQPYGDEQQYYEQQQDLGQQPDLEQKQEEQPSAEAKPKVLDMLDTDTESAKQDTKISNDSDFDFSNA